VEGPDYDSKIKALAEKYPGIDRELLKYFVTLKI